MANSKKTKKCDNKEDKEKGNEPDSAVFWLKKIFEKMENIETCLAENSNLIKQNSQKLENIHEEVKGIKEQCNKGSGSSNNKKTSDLRQQTKEAISLSPVIRNALISRKLAYYKMIRCEGIANIYKGFLQLNPPYIPNKFREASIDNESEKHRERMRKLEIQKINFEIEHLEELGERHKQTMENSELEVKQHIGEQDDPIQRQSLKEEWYASSKKEEEKSEAIWDKKKEFFESLPTRMENDQPRRVYGKTSDYNAGKRSNHYNNARTKAMGNYHSGTYSGNYQPNAHSVRQGPSNRVNDDGRNQNYNRNANNQNFPQHYFLRRNR
mgnify:CR=1 FL=1